MTLNFVRYSPDVEHIEPDFGQTLKQVLDDMKQHMRGSLKTEGIGLVVRNAHAKGYGLARGEFEILSGLPNEYTQGIYAKPGRHEAMVRFSNGTNHVGGDRFLGPITGIGLKIFGIEGKTLLEDEPDSQHQITAEGWFVADPDLTLAEIERLKRLGKATDEFLEKVG
jgi:hypothetical protein